MTALLYNIKLALAGICMILMFVLGGIVVALTVLLLIFFPLALIILPAGIAVITTMRVVRNFFKKKQGKMVW